MTPEVANQELTLLQQLDPANPAGLYFQATFLESQGKKQQALDVLRKITNKGPSTSQLEQRIIAELEINTEPKQKKRQA